MLQVGASHLVRVPDGRARLAMGPYEGFAVWVLLQRHGYTAGNLVETAGRAQRHARVAGDEPSASFRGGRHTFVRARNAAMSGRRMPLVSGHGPPRPYDLESRLPG